MLIPCSASAAPNRSIDFKASSLRMNCITSCKKMHLLRLQNPVFFPKAESALVTNMFNSVRFESNEWIAVEGQSEGTFVKVGYPNSLSGFFTIHRVSSANSYKFQFCSTDGKPCGNVGIVKDEAGNRLLAINQETPFEFVLTELPSAVSK
ncbi:uncharacterized protein HKW66_Vig0042760 [Vigna angularis]|uniref:Uncharacterized protein n=1 Tax=Phaseolus angularis TaxID=3914 RepID=A0A8T0L062_PHAAN|nr:uncharacterized protein HKW66_Vig0042760 [Vigna angularis]